MTINIFVLKGDLNGKIVVVRLFVFFCRVYYSVTSESVYYFDFCGLLKWGNEFELWSGHIFLLRKYLAVTGENINTLSIRNLS